MINLAEIGAEMVHLFFTAKQLYEFWLSTGDILSLKLMLLDIKSSITNRKSQIFNKTADLKCGNHKS